MKIPVLIFHLIQLSILAFGQQNHGQISQIQSGSYRILYPSQIVKVYFDYTPSNGLQHITNATDLNENEQYEVVNVIKQQIDQLPEPFIIKYLNIDILPMQIDNKSEFGYNLDQQIIVEAGKIKQGMSYRNSVKSALAHQTAYLLMDNPNTRQAAQSIQKYLNSLYQTFHNSNGSAGYSIYEQGYVSRYASGELSGDYNPAMEFAELFAHLTCDENRYDLLEFLDNHPENILSIKVRRYIDFLTENVTGFDHSYFYPSEKHAYTIPTTVDPDGEVLLSIHELRSYESLDFNAMEEQEKVWTSKDEDDVLEELPTKSWEEDKPEAAYEVLSYSEKSSSFGPQDAQKQQPPKKKKKKKNGRGLLIAGAAIYVLLQLAK